MTLLALFKEAVLHPQQLFPTTRLKKKTAILYFLLLSFILMIPTIFNSFRQIQTYNQDLAAITQKLPDFSIKDNQLSTTEKETSFIYQTDYMLFAFDPEGKLSADNLRTQLVGSQIGVGLLKNGLALSTTSNHPFSYVLGNDEKMISYKSFNTDMLTKKFFEGFSFSAGQKTSMVILVFLMTLLPVMIGFGLYLWMGAFIGHTFEGAKFLGLKLKNSFNLFLTAATLPVLFATLLSVFVPTFDSLLLIIVATMIIYSNILKDMKRQLFTNNQQK